MVEDSDSEHIQIIHKMISTVNLEQECVCEISIGLHKHKVNGSTKQMNIGVDVMLKVQK